MRNWDLERLRNLPKVAQLVGCRAKGWTLAWETGRGKLLFAHQCSDFGTSLTTRFSPKYPLLNWGASPSSRCISLKVIWLWYYPATTLVEVEKLSSTIKVAKVLYLPRFSFISFSDYLPHFPFGKVKFQKWWTSFILLSDVFSISKSCCCIREIQNEFCKSSFCLWKQLFEVHELECHQEPKESWGSGNQEAEIDIQPCLSWFSMGVTQFSRLLIFLHLIYLPKDIL